MIIKKTIGEKTFDVFNYIVLLLFGAVCLIPFIHIAAGSFSESQMLVLNRFILFPTKFSLEAYKYIFTTDTLPRSLMVTAFITVVGTVLQLFFTALSAYPLSNVNLVGRKYIMGGIVFTMFFSGGMIPGFLVVKMLGLLDTYWALLIPGCINTFNLILMKNFFQSIPAELPESAKIDGCNELIILIKIIIPLSLPAMATFALFYAVGNWNIFYSAILYINDSSKWPIQVILRQIVILGTGGVGDIEQLQEKVKIPEETVKMATIVIATLPVLMVYPFLQKYFVKGVMLGSVKG